MYAYIKFYHVDNIIDSSMLNVVLSLLYALVKTMSYNSEDTNSFVKSEVNILVRPNSSNYV